MQTVYLNGGISQFGERWEADCTNIRDIFKLIDCQTPGFRQYLMKAAEAGVDFEIQRGEDFLSEPEELFLDLRDEDIIITEVPAGSKSGVGKILAAFVIAYVTMGMAAGTMNLFAPGALKTGATVAMGSKAGLLALSVATNLALAGVTQLLSPGPEVDAPGENEDGYLFNGPVTRSPEGIVVPVVYGEMVIGGQPIASAFRTSSPFADTSALPSNDIFQDPDDGSVQTSAGGGAADAPATGGGGEVPASNSQGVPSESAPTTYPDPRDVERNIQDIAEAETPIFVPNIHFGLS